VQDQEGFLWLSTNKELLKFDGYEVEIYRHDPEDTTSLADNNIGKLFVDTGGNLWAGHTKGLSRYNPNGNCFVNYTLTSSRKSACMDPALQHRFYNIPQAAVFAITEGRHRQLWAATAGGDLFRYDRKKDTFLAYQTDPPAPGAIPPLFINVLLADRHNNLWIGAGRDREEGGSGLIRLDLNTGATRRFMHEPEKDQFIPVIKGDVAEVVLEDESGFWIPTIKRGLLHIDPNTGSTQRFTEEDGLPSNETVQYTNLPPGEYTFEVKAANRDGVWTQEALVLPFHIRAAWWTSWWFYSLSLALIAGLGYWFYHFQLSKTLAVQKSIRLQEVNQLTTTLYNNITHEFRTPLTVILGMTENLRSEMAQQQLDHFVPPLQMITRNGQHLLQLVNEMLDLAKVESGKLTLNLVQGDVIAFIKYLVEGFHALAASQHIQLDIQAAEQTLVMDFDPHKLAIVVSNLLSNALKFVPGGGAITVHLAPVFRAGAARFSIAVKDNGIGIAAAEIPHLFDRFYQADQAAGRPYQGNGNGIGLALTKELVALMKGTIQVESEPGKGSEFTVLLPIHRNAALAENTLNGSVPASSQNTVDNYFQEELLQEDDQELPLVLVIEDQPDVVHYISTCLQGKYRQVHAPNGMLGMETAFEKIPDLIICDVMMPEKDGFEVCATLKQDERTNHIPVILLTARVAAADRLAGLAQGADAYLTKPFDKKELLIRLQQLFELRKTLQKKYGKQLFLGTPGEKTVPPEDPFMARARVIVLSELDTEHFSVNELSDQLYLSRSQVHRKIKAVAGISTAIFIRMIRMQEAKKLLVTTPLTISEIAYQTGFKTPTYFSQIFKQTFGESPSDFRK